MVRKKGERLQAALQYLVEAGGTAKRLDVWNAAQARVPLDGDETELNSKSEPNGAADFFWGSTALVGAGYLEKRNRGEWTVTRQGAEASTTTTSGGEFLAEVNRQRRDAALAAHEDEAAALSSMVLPAYPGAVTVRKTLDVFVEQGLRGLDSVFAPGRDVWRAEVADEVHRRFVGRPEVAGADFLEKLGEQFSDASDDAKLLMAELICWQLLPLSTPGENKKRQRVQRLLDGMAHPVTIPDLIDSTFAVWSFNPGQAMAVRIFHGLSIIVEAVVAWVRLDAEQREELLDDPWAWREFVAALPGYDFPSQRNELVYLVHPGSFGEVISKYHRDAIREAFVGEVEGQIEADPDEALRQITIALQEKSGKAVRFYEDPLWRRWHPEEEDVSEEEAPVLHSRPSMRRTPFPPVAAALPELLHMSADWLQDTLDLIERRKQVILYGPPGTGKTFLAQALSKHVTDGTDGDTTIVQFHPTYSYEDFFEGFRPVADDDSGNLAFTLRKGPLRRLADAAAANPEANYFLVIDEINRGNIAKVFGELYFLLEYRDSEISLLYSDEPFTLPSNIFVIGTMNTTDRSIAMLDAAMRRRFAFVELHPEREPVQEVLARWTATKGLHDDRAELLTRLNAQIHDHDAKVGPSFLMRDLGVTGLQDVWRYEILPLLAEHHYGEGVDVEDRYGLRALRRQATSSAADGTEGASVDH